MSQITVNGQLLPMSQLTHILALQFILVFTAFNQFPTHVQAFSTFMLPDQKIRTPQSHNALTANPRVKQFPVKKNAYATMMYCGTARDYQYYIATRVLMKGLQKHEPDADLVVIVSRGCPSEWLEAYATDGLRIIEVSDIPNPYQEQAKFERRFVSSLNKLHAWSLTDYNRVVMLDADNIFIRNTDELFQCGEFCAAFIDPCLFHTGLFVLKPSNETYQTMVQQLGKLRSRDGGDQGFLISFFPDLLSETIFRPPKDGSILTGHFRLPFSYQMDTSYFYWRLKWRVPCGPNSVITFPGMPSLKPWFWYTWPLLPLGLMWHDERLHSIGYVNEAYVMAMEAIAYVVMLLLGIALRHFAPLEKTSSVKFCFNRLPDFLPYPLCHTWAIKGATMAYLTLSILLPFVIIPTTSHPLVGWALYFFGSFVMLFTLTSFLSLPLLPMLTPWLCLVVSWLNMASPFYSHGLPRLFSIAALTSILTPVLWWSLREILSSLDNLIERAPLMAGQFVRAKRQYSSVDLA